MVKKRLIFTLLYSDGSFMLSRNFRLQKVGDIGWIERNYNFAQIARCLDELIVLNVSRGEKRLEEFGTVLKRLIDFCFIPVSAGGGISSPQHARALFHSGADKLVINSALWNDVQLVRELVQHYGSQSIIASLDCRLKDGSESGGYQVVTDTGQRPVDAPFDECIRHVVGLGVGEIYLNSMDRDGTGHGYDLQLLEQTRAAAACSQLPIIMAGGAGNCRHFAEVIQLPEVDAVATANLFNFIGDTLPAARQRLCELGVPLAVWK